MSADAIERPDRRPETITLTRKNAHAIMLECSQAFELVRHMHEQKVIGNDSTRTVMQGLRQSAEHLRAHLYPDRRAF